MFDLLKCGHYFRPKLGSGENGAPPFLGLENPIVCRIMVSLHDMWDPSLCQDRIQQTGLSFVVQNTDPLQPLLSADISWSELLRGLLGGKVSAALPAPGGLVLVLSTAV